MGNEEEEKEEKNKLVHFCKEHLLQLDRSFANLAIRRMVKIVEPIVFSTYMFGKGFTTFEDVEDEISGVCPNCYWDKLMTVTVSILQTLGYPVSIEDIREKEIEKPSPSIWKN